MKRACLIILLSIPASVAFSQGLSNLRLKEMVLSGDSIVLDSMSIVPGSFSLFDSSGSVFPDTLYKIDYSIPSLKWHSALNGLQANAIFRVFPLNFTAIYATKDLSVINDFTKMPKDPFRLSGSELRSEGFYSSADIDRSGSLARGISIGNNQDLVVNSNLNLQLSGKISEDLNIVAAISDNNIPIQPEGTSQQIHEFDKVYIEVFNERLSLTAGDFDLEGSPGYFMNFYKKGKGAKFSGNFLLKKDQSATMHTTISGAVSKGKFARNSFYGKEGSQGPYKLRGSNNEQFIIILAGTEKVFIDGRLMSRGLENDYVIDYNNAEITFTPNRLITKDKRIIVEFEYSEKSYARFLIYNSNEFRTQKGNFWINIYSEQDDKNQTLQQDLSDEDRELLAGIGDELENAVVQRIDSVGFNSNEVLYARIDTLVNGNLYSDIYIYSTSPDKAVYRLGFSYVGEGNGNYQPVNSAANGRVFQWIAPSLGHRGGSYEPVVLLIAPKKKQVVSIGGATRLSQSTHSWFELSLSNNDFNTFSGLGNRDNVGYALRGRIMQDILPGDTSVTRLMAGANYQLINRYFDPIERFRSVEFERDWNLLSNHAGVDEHMTALSLDFYRRDIANAGLQTEYLYQGDIYRGLRNHFSGNLNVSGFTFLINGSLMNSTDPLYSTRFFRNQALISKNIKYIVLGIREEAENNRWFNNPSDSLVKNSLSYRQWEFFITTPDTFRNKVILNYTLRSDYLPARNSLNLATTGRDINAGFNLAKNPANILKAIFTYRTLVINDSSLTAEEKDHSLLARIDHALVIKQGFITSSTFYEIGSGLEARKEFAYLEVTPGQGVYTWSDYNGNSVKELDEFEVARFRDEASYIRIFTPTDDFINAYTNQFNQVFNLNPSKLWHDNTGVMKIISLFSDQFAYRVDRKNTRSDLLKNINPFNARLDDPNLLTIATSIRNNFSFNRIGQKIGIDYIFQQNKSRILLANGFDSRDLKSNGLRARWNISNGITLINQSDMGLKSFESAFFSSRNYRISFLTNEFSVQYQPGISFGFAGTYNYSDEKTELDDEHAEKHDFGIELRYNILKKGNITGKLNYINIGFNRNPDTPVAYEMLQGLQPGNNGIWTLLFQRMLTGGVELNIEYSGRAFENQKVVHVGSVQIRWNF